LTQKSSGVGRKPKLFDLLECKNCVYKGSRYCWNQKNKKI